ncbi:cadherin-related family member 1 [Lingula anatina]|uniref:Cadherin-related family member 1 n=1 Tax=Lingula anatina TaxID=7574 RepID=A0A2R2MS92_LINAN|nr:cadherin-related family member 1 [Lingula anatina]|eukprot:XP_023932998.1 cadherin-related family member 1 [Lingula anatina]
MDLRLFYLGVTLLWVHTAQCQSNRAPNWVEDLSSIISIQGIREGLPIGSEIGTLIAEDPENDPVSYTTTSDTFNVDRTSGLVTLAKNLDYESTDQNLKVQFVASDNLNNRSPVDLNVAIIDVNDNPPVFLNSENYNSKVREDAAVGEVLTNDQNAVRIRDVDTQENAKVTLRCYYQSLRDVQAYEACQMFNVTEVKVDTGVYLAKITLNKPLDFETKRSYTLTMRATDGVHEDYKNFVIEVEDVQDSLPRFFNTPITFNVTENAPAGTSIYTLYAEDQDLGNPNPLNIKLISDPLGFFTLQQGTPEGSRYSAVVKSSGRIDREKLGTSSNYVILAQAVEMENGVEISTHVNTTIMVQVVDLNDNRPQFDHEVYVVNVTEGLRLNTPLPNLDIRVTDADQGSNARFNLSILQDPYGTFSLSPVETQQREARPTLIVANEDNMDYDSETRGFRNQQIVLKAQGFDGSFDTATVLVNLIDINDNSPTFSSPIYDLKLREDQPLNVPLDVTIKASDKDSGIFGQVRYNISGDGQEKFYINPSSGTLSLVSPLSIDSGVRAYHIQVTATDGGGEFDRVPLYVTVLDNNDNAPVFDTRTYRTSVMEDDTSLDPPITVKAEDTDAGSDIGYNITQGNTADAAFQLDPVSGVLTLTRGLRMTDTPGGTGL